MSAESEGRVAKPAQDATVLVVDDELMVLTALESFLQLETSYKVLAHTSPAQALEAVQAEVVHVVIADFMMPGMDGITFLRQVREMRPQATRILLTGYADKENAIRAINEANLYHYLEKPWDNEFLKIVIRNGVERATLFDELDARVGALESANSELYEIRRRITRAFL
jgi:response regulator RpfG family c-di-GMP phosphodiesterase